MELELKFGHALCYTPTFKINGIDADLGLHILNRAFEICEQNKIVQGQLFS